jgi:hypothetical protein
VGKTTTARCAAEDIRRPLIEISAGDIRWDAKHILIAFDALLNKAARWRAAILIEDVQLMFPENNNDVPQGDHDALAMLSALEKHRGLLFCTTDRIGRLARHIRSRTTLPIYLPPPVGNIRVSLMKQLLQDLGGTQVMEVGRWYDESILKLKQEHESYVEAVEEINGWDIKNIVSVAQKLAQSERRVVQEEDIAASLKMQLKHKRYISDVFNGTENAQASMSHFRAPEGFGGWKLEDDSLCPPKRWIQRPAEHPLSALSGTSSDDDS